jgi:hypothetical protein
VKLGPTHVKSESFSAHEDLLGDNALHVMLAETRQLILAVRERSERPMLLPFERERLIAGLRNLQRREDVLLSTIDRRGETQGQKKEVAEKGNDSCQ